MGTTTDLTCWEGKEARDIMVQDEAVTQGMVLTARF